VRLQTLENESRDPPMPASGGKAGTGGAAPHAAPVEDVAVQELPPAGGTRTAALSPGTSTSGTRSDATPQRPLFEPAALVSPAPVVTQEPVRRTQIYVQAGAFTQVANAIRMRARLASLGNVQISKALVGPDNFNRVRLGPVATVAQADQTLELLLNNGFNDARVVVD
jgi:rare lipoprotein A